MGTKALPPPLEVYSILESLTSSGIPKSGTAQIIDFGSDQFISFFEKEMLDEFISKGGATCRIFEGVYGSGKSHLLQLIEEQAVDKGYLVCHIELKKDIDFSRPHIITKHVLENCYGVIDGQKVRRFPDIIEAASIRHSLDVTLLNKMSLQHPGVRNAILYAARCSELDNGAWDFLRRYLLGEKILVQQFNKAGLKGIKKSLTEKNAEQFLNSILNSIHLLGFKGIILLYDETERSWASNRSPTPKKVQNAANIIRRFVDACSFGDIQGTLVLFAVLPNFIQDCINCYPALGQRLARPVTSLEMAWRWPVLPVSATNSLLLNVTSFSEEKAVFFEAAKKKFRDLVEYCGGDLIDIDEEFEEIGSHELNKWSHEEYRRWLIKVLSTCAIDRIERSGALFDV